MDMDCTMDCEMETYDPSFYQYDTDTLPTAIETFVKNGGDVNGMYNIDFVSNLTETPMYFAVQVNSPLAVKLLLEAGADPNRTANVELMPLHIACDCLGQESLEIAALLLNYGADLLGQDRNGSSPVHFAFRARHTKLVDMLLARLPKGANLADCQNLTIFHIACAQGADGVVRDLLDSGVPIDHCTEDAWRRIQMNGLKFAVMDNRISTVELLLQRGTDVTSVDSLVLNLLHSACEFNSEKFVAHLEGEYVEMREDMEISERSHLGILNLLLDYGVNVNATNESGLTPLLYVCTDRFTSTANWRRSLSFRENSTMEREHQHMIARRRLVVQYLLERGATINARSPDGKSLLHLEFDCNFGRRVPYDDEVMRLFMRYGADVNARDERLFTPLHVIFDHALYYNNSMYSCRADQKIMLLLRYGADVNARTDDDLTPVALFVKNFYGNEKQLRKCSRLKMMLVHAQRLVTLGLFVDEEIRDWMKRLDLEECRTVKQECIDELARMKRDYIGDISLYRMLRTGLDEADQCVGEYQLQKIVEGWRIPEKYPQYSYLFELSMRRGPMLKQAESALKRIAHCELPHLCTQVIFKQLTDFDLKNLAEITRSKRRVNDREDDEPNGKKRRL